MSSDSTRNLRGIESPRLPLKQGRLVISVIGIDEYWYWPRLHNAVNDALGFQQVLVDKFGFTKPIEPLLNQDATKEAIGDLIDKLRHILQGDDSLVLYFAGHGHTREDWIGEKKIETGFIVPVEARTKLEGREPWRDYIEVDPLLKSLDWDPNDP